MSFHTQGFALYNISYINDGASGYRYEIGGDFTQIEVSFSSASLSLMSLDNATIERRQGNGWTAAIFDEPPLTGINKLRLTAIDNEVDVSVTFVGSGEITNIVEISQAEG